MSERHAIACLDVYAPEVREVIRRVAPPSFDISFAESYDEAEQHALAASGEFILAGWAAVTADMMRADGSLTMIQKWGIGIDRIDIEAARRAGVGVTITAGSNAGPVAEHAIMLMLATLRRLPYVDRKLRQGEWVKAEMRSVCLQLTGKTVGLVGFGNIGRMVAKKLRGFECRVLYSDVTRVDAAVEAALEAQYVALEDLLAQSDVVSIHAPLTQKTRGLIGRSALALMKRSAILVNTARGEIVDESALHEALSAGSLHGAGLDAFDPEPPDRDNQLLLLDSVAVTPHTGGAVFDNVENVARHALGNIERILLGQELAPADVIVPIAARAMTNTFPPSSPAPGPISSA